MGEDERTSLRFVRLFSEVRTAFDTVGISRRVVAWLCHTHDVNAFDAFAESYVLLISASKTTRAERERAEVEPMSAPRLVTIQVDSTLTALRRAVEFADLWFADSDAVGASKLGAGG